MSHERLFRGFRGFGNRRELPGLPGQRKGIIEMCLAIPAEVISIEDEMATVRVGDALRKASLMLLPEKAELGDFVIVHAGFALHKVDPDEAKESLRLLRELASIPQGEAGTP